MKTNNSFITKCILTVFTCEVLISCDKDEIMLEDQQLIEESD